jgi:hypothetical protein
MIDMGDDGKITDIFESMCAHGTPIAVRTPQGKADPRQLPSQSLAAKKPPAAKGETLPIYG